MSHEREAEEFKKEFEAEDRAAGRRFPAWLRREMSKENPEAKLPPEKKPWSSTSNSVFARWLRGEFADPEDVARIKKRREASKNSPTPWVDRNRCEDCGKRLKFKPGAVYARYATCRACGHRQSWVP